MSLLSLAKLTLTAHLNPISNSSSCREAPSHLSLIQFDWPSLWAMLDGTLCEVDRAFYPALVEGDLSVHFWLCSEKINWSNAHVCAIVSHRAGVWVITWIICHSSISVTPKDETGWKSQVSVGGFLANAEETCHTNANGLYLHSLTLKWSTDCFFLEMHELDNLPLCPSWTLCGLHLIWKLVNCLRSLSRSDREVAEISF